MINPPRFPIGLKFDYYGVKHNKAREIVDIFTTTNSAGDVVKYEYVLAQNFLGQTLLSYAHDASIARSLNSEQLALYVNQEPTA